MTWSWKHLVTCVVVVAVVVGNEQKFKIQIIFTIISLYFSIYDLICLFYIPTKNTFKHKLFFIMKIVGVLYYPHYITVKGFVILTNQTEILKVTVTSTESVLHLAKNNITDIWKNAAEIYVLHLSLCHFSICRRPLQ